MFKERIKKLFSRTQENAAPNGKRILAIDDDEGQRLMIQRTLEKSGYAVTTAENGQNGIDLARAQKPDLILLDVIMPGIHGDDVCKALKSDYRTKDIPILFLTSLDTPKDVIDHYNLGAEVHLTKPIQPKELISQIEITFEGKK